MKDFKVTKEGGLRGTELLNELSTATGLPNEMIGEELSRLISTAGKSTEDVTLDELRDMLAAYLQDVLLEAKDSFETEAQDEVKAAAEAIAEEAGRATSNSSAKVISLTSVQTNHGAYHSSGHASGHAVGLATSTPTFAMFSNLGSSAPDFIGEG